MKPHYSNNAYQRAKSKVEKLKDFYTHLCVFVVINTVISAVKIMNNLNNGETFWEALIDFSTLITWMVWGVALVLHALSAFEILVFFGDEWRAKKIEEFMKDELQNP
ncbi:MAG: 2TM domain-containing protein [Winogradskyella arenosi]